MVKNGPNSLRYSTSTLSLRPTIAPDPKSETQKIAEAAQQNNIDMQNNTDIFAAQGVLAHLEATLLDAVGQAQLEGHRKMAELEARITELQAVQQTNEELSTHNSDFLAPRGVVLESADRKGNGRQTDGEVNVDIGTGRRMIPPQGLETRMRHLHGLGKEPVVDTKGKAIEVNTDLSGNTRGKMIPASALGLETRWRKPNWLGSDAKPYPVARNPLPAPSVGGNPAWLDQQTGFTFPTGGNPFPAATTPAHPDFINQQRPEPLEAHGYSSISPDLPWVQAQQQLKPMPATYKHGGYQWLNECEEKEERERVTDAIVKECKARNGFDPIPGNSSIPLDEEVSEAQGRRQGKAAALGLVSPSGLENRPAIDAIQTKVQRKFDAHRRHESGPYRLRAEAKPARSSMHDATLYPWRSSGKEDTSAKSLFEEYNTMNADLFQKDNEAAGKSLFEKYKTTSADLFPKDVETAGKVLFENYKISNADLFPKDNETVQERALKPKGSLITKGLVREGNALKAPEAYTQPFCDFLTENPTVFHAVDYFEKKLEKAGFKKLSERKTWNDELKKAGKYYVSRNGSSLIAFTIGGGYKSGNGVAMVAGHIDALTARLKPMSAKKNAAGYVQLGVAPYSGSLNETWWDRDLGVAGRVLVKGSDGKITTRLVKLGWPIARIPTLAPHFGVGMMGQNNKETQAVPIIGLDNSDIGAADEFQNLTLGGAGSFAATQPPKLVRAIAGELSIHDHSSIVNWELELFDTQPAQTGGLEKEFIFAGRIDDKLCSWSAMEGLLASAATSVENDGIVKLVGVFDDEEIGSLLRQGARGNFLPGTIERITESFGGGANVLSQTYANSFLISADVTHAVNPNFLGTYLEGHAPRLNVGLVVSADSNGHTTTDSVSTALLTRVAEKSDSRLQLFMVRNDSRSGGTVGPMLSSAMGVRAIDAGMPQLSMHSIRATTGALDPGLGVKVFKGFFDHFESVDMEFE